MVTRSRMTHRATVERDTPAGTDGFGGPGASSWAAHIASLACYYWTKNQREVIGDKIATLTVHQMVVPSGTDITVEDRVTFIKDRAAVNLVSNTMSVRTVIRRADHIVVGLEEVNPVGA